MTLSLANLSGTIYPFYVAWLDILGDPVRATTKPGGHTFTSGETSDADLIGQTFVYIPAEFVSVTPITHSSSGSDTVTVTLSGLPGPNDDLLTAIATGTNWRGRVARVWKGLGDSTGAILEVAADLTGYMMTMPIAGDPRNGQTVSVSIENYLAILGAARNRTYQDQAEFDAADVSSARIRTSANGITAASIINGSGGGGRVFGDSQYSQLQ